MENKDLIEQLKKSAEDFSKEEISEIIDIAAKAFIDNNPFANEEELAESTLENLLSMFSSYDRETIKKVQEKIMEIIP